MSSSDPTTEASLLNLLLFSVGGVSFGVDLEQIDGMAEHTGEPDTELHWLHILLGFGNIAVTYRLPTVLSIKTDSGKPYRVIIDNMEEIIELRWSDITPFPVLLEPYVITCGLWGILQRSGKMVLLVDFQRIARNGETPPNLPFSGEA